MAEGVAPGIAEIRELFPGQLEIVERYWSGDVGNPEEQYWGWAGESGRAPDGNTLSTAVAPTACRPTANPCRCPTQKRYPTRAAVIGAAFVNSPCRVPAPSERRPLIAPSPRVRCRRRCHAGGRSLLRRSGGPPPRSTHNFNGWGRRVFLTPSGALAPAGVRPLAAGVLSGVRILRDCGRPRTVTDDAGIQPSSATTADRTLRIVEIPYP